MDLDLSEEQHELESATRDLLDGEKTVEMSRALAEERENAGKAVCDLWRRMVALDWPALTIPERNGGLGLGTVELAVVSEQLGRALTPGPFLATASQFVTAVKEVGTAPQRELFLDPVAEEGTPGTLAFAEPSGGFDFAGIDTIFRPLRGGYVLDGTKAYVMEASRAEQIAVVARRDKSSGADGLGVFVVPGGADGLGITPINATDSTRELATVSLESVRVGPECALGQPGECASALVRVLQIATDALAAEMVGTCQRIVDEVLEHVTTREQFGVRIGSFQAIKHKLANMYVSLESARATVRFAAAAIDERDVRAPLAVSMAKAAVGDSERLIGVEGIQCLGGIGYTWEHDMHLYVKRVRTAAALFGTAEQHRARVAELIGL